MNPIPTGRVMKNDAGTYDLMLTRTFNAPIDDVWASITDPERTERWFGTWRGEAGPGQMVQLQMGFEEGAGWSDVRINACQAPSHLSVSTVDEHGSWHLDANLSERNGVTTLEFMHRQIIPADAENVGPGWEYYLDMLVASRDNRPLPDFGDYYPAQAAYFAAQVEAEI
jgi:uncharacterized protein YndB with AHSA1/START domain